MQLVCGRNWWRQLCERVRTSARAHVGRRAILIYKKKNNAIRISLRALDKKKYGWKKNGKHIPGYTYERDNTRTGETTCVSIWATARRTSHDVGARTGAACRAHIQTNHNQRHVAGAERWRVGGPDCFLAGMFNSLPTCSIFFPPLRRPGSMAVGEQDVAICCGRWKICAQGPWQRWADAIHPPTTFFVMALGIDHKGPRRPARSRHQNLRLLLSGPWPGTCFNVSSSPVSIRISNLGPTCNRYISNIPGACYISKLTAATAAHSRTGMRPK